MTDLSDMPAHHGTIIVDSSALISLGCPTASINQRAPHAPKTHLYDILPILAEQGCKIAIPEEAVYQVTHSVVINGELKSLDPYFSDKKRDMAGNLPFHKAEREFIHFFNKVLAGKYPGIDIVLSKDLSGDRYHSCIQNKKNHDAVPNTKRCCKKGINRGTKGL